MWCHADACLHIEARFQPSHHCNHHYVSHLCRHSRQLGFSICSKTVNSDIAFSTSWRFKRCENACLLLAYLHRAAITALAAALDERVRTRESACAHCERAFSCARVVVRARTRCGNIPNPRDSIHWDHALVCIHCHLAHVPAKCPGSIASALPNQHRWRRQTAVRVALRSSRLARTSVALTPHASRSAEWA